jgi:hypothetical protein
MKIPKTFLSEELLRQLREKKVVRQGDYTYRDLDEEYVEVIQVKKYRRPEEMLDETFSRWVLHG